MTQNQFNAICQAHTIAPDIAMDKPRVVQLLKDDRGRASGRAVDELHAILATEF